MRRKPFDVAALIVAVLVNVVKAYPKHFVVDGGEY